MLVNTLLHSLSYSADAIFSGLKILIPVLFIVILLKTKLKWPDLPSLVISANILLLSGGLLFMTTLLTDALFSIQSGNEERWDLMMSIMTGPTAYQMLIPIFCFGLLPNIMWIKKFRSKILPSLIVVLIWINSNYLVDYLRKQQGFDFPKFNPYEKLPLLEYSEKAFLFLVFLVLVYVIVLRKKSVMPKV